MHTAVKTFSGIVAFNGLVISTATAIALGAAGPALAFTGILMACYKPLKKLNAKFYKAYMQH